MEFDRNPLHRSQPYVVSHSPPTGLCTSRMLVYLVTLEPGFPKWERLVGLAGFEPTTSCTPFLFPPKQIGGALQNEAKSGKFH